MKQIVYGICGIGSGHTFRQLPVIDELARTNRIMVLAYDESYRFYEQHLAGRDNVRLARVAVPFYVGGRAGLDFAATAAHPANQGQDFVGVNARALAETAGFVGRPDVVISDYEPVSAQYAYATGAPLVTIDQQSKFLLGNFPAELHGQTYDDEVARLRMFFPKAAARLACSFFRVEPRTRAAEAVLLFGPVLRPEILALQRTMGSGRPVVVVYITAQQSFRQSLEEIMAVGTAVPEADIHIFYPRAQERTGRNVRVWPHGTKQFMKSLAVCTGLVSTAGHTLLSEAMHLGIPVYAMPLDLYEQLLNAAAIGRGGFGVVRPKMEVAELQDFVRRAPDYAQAIKHDTRTLLQGPGQTEMIRFLRQTFDLD